MDYKKLRSQRGRHDSPTSPTYQFQHQIQQLPDDIQIPDLTGWTPQRASSPATSLSSRSELQSMGPSWAREQSISLHPRHSRASSIVSTKTKTSINTIQEDTKSVDIVLGAQSFHINRDGSKISVSNREELPPYTPPGPSNTESNPETVASDELDDSASLETPREISTANGADYLDNSLARTGMGALFTSGEPSNKPFPWSRPIHWAPTAHVDGYVGLNPPGIAAELELQPNAEATPVKKQTQRTWKSLPIKPGLGAASLGRNRRSVSHSDMHEQTKLMDGTKDSIPWLRRRNSVQLPKIFADESSATRRKSYWDDPVHGSLADPITRPAGPSFGKSNHRSLKSSSSAEGDPSNKAAVSAGSGSAFTLPRHGLSSSDPSGSQLAVPESPAHFEEGLADSEAPPPMESDNDISIHYTRLIRSIDRDHRRALHQRDKELAKMRERLNEVDQVYRKELKSRDFTIEDLRTRLRALEDDMQNRIEKAQYEVEDLWEKRWKDRDRHLVERMRRIELDSQKSVERAVAERDEEWGAEWAKKNEQLLKRLKVADEAARRNLPLP